MASGVLLSCATRGPAQSHRSGFGPTSSQLEALPTDNDPVQPKGLPLQHFVGKPITDFTPKDLKDQALSPVGAPRVDVKSGGTQLTSYDLESLDPTYRATCLSIVDGQETLHLQDTNGDGNVDNATRTLLDVRGGQQRALTTTLVDRKGVGEADMKVVGKYISDEGAEMAHALSQQFYEGGRKTIDTTQQVVNGKSVPLSAASFQAMFNK